MLKKTLEYMKNKKETGYVESYAILVSKDGKSETIMSDDVDQDTYFDVASMGKVLVTSTLILQAVGNRMIGLDDTLENHFTYVPEDKKNITIKQLLTHTSGIVRITIPDRIADCGKEIVAEHILDSTLRFPPDTGYEYSCNGYILLGFILEKIYKMPLDEIYYKHLVKPLGLKRSRFNISLNEDNAAICYRWKHPGKLRVDDENVYSMGGIAGSGASFSSIADMRIFMESVLAKDERLYKKELFEIAEKDHTPNYAFGRGLGYSYVDQRFSQTGKLFADGSFGHCGHSGASFFIDRKNNMYVVILSNATRCLNKKNNFRGYDYNEIMNMRKEIHNAIGEDIIAGCCKK